MKISNMGQIITIESKEKYTLEELYNLLKEKGNFESGEPELKKIMGVQNIVFPGTSGFCNIVSISKNKITMAQQKTSAKGIGLSTGLSFLTGGWSDILNAEGKKNAKIMEAIGTEIERIVS